jgi:hypothetical protein
MVCIAHLVASAEMPKNYNWKTIKLAQEVTTAHHLMKQLSSTIVEDNSYFSFH